MSREPADPVTALRHQLLRDRIIAAAETLIAKDSLASVTLDAVAARAQCSKTSIYKLFRNRPGLLIAIYRKRSDELHDDLRASMNAGKPVRDTLIDYARHNIRITHSDRHIAVMRSVFLELQGAPTLGREVFLAGPGAAIRDLEAYLKRECARGHLAIADARRAARHFVGAFHWALQYEQLLGARRAPRAKEIEAEADTVVEMFLRAYAPP